MVVILNIGLSTELDSVAATADCASAFFAEDRAPHTLGNPLHVTKLIKRDACWCILYTPLYADAQPKQDGDAQVDRRTR